jgi:Acyl-CoA dehydrogenase, N-terminal domain
VAPDAGRTLPGRLAAAIEAIEAIDPGDTYNPVVPEALVASGLHRLCLPLETGGLGGGMVEAVDVLAALGAVSGSAALGFAMHTHVVGALVESDAWPAELRAWVEGLVVAEGALLNSAALPGRSDRARLPGCPRRPDQPAARRHRPPGVCPATGGRRAGLEPALNSGPVQPLAPRRPRSWPLRSH